MVRLLVYSGLRCTYEEGFCWLSLGVSGLQWFHSCWGEVICKDVESIKHCLSLAPILGTILFVSYYNQKTLQY